MPPILIAMAVYAILASAANEVQAQPKNIPPKIDLSANMPEEAGGPCKWFTSVSYPDDKATIHTWLCNGQLQYAIDDTWPPVALPKAVAARGLLLRKMQNLEGYARGGPRLEALKERARQQMQDYGPTVDQIRKKAIAQSKSIV